MVNDLSHITETSPDPRKVPGMIWWPLIPAEETLEELAKRRPDMHLQVAMACIAGNYTRLWDKLSPEPCRQLWKQASQWDDSIRNHYVDYLKRRATELGIDINHLGTLGKNRAEDQCLDAARLDKEPTTTYVPRDISIEGEDKWPDSYDVYGGMEQFNAAEWELHICTSKEVWERVPGSYYGLWLYRDDKYGVHLTTPETPTETARDTDST
jgi:hypothetical protein